MKYCPKCATPLQRQDIDAAERFVCHNKDCNFIHWNNPVPVVTGLVQHRGDYILARNSRWPGKIFSLIAGYLEAGETPEQAIVREVKEELGLEAQIQRYIGHYSFFPKNQLILAFELTAPEGEIQLSEELAEFKRLNREQLLGYSFGPLKITTAIINDWRQNRQ